MGGRDALANSYACAVVVVWEPLPGGGSMNPDSLSGVNGYILLAWLDRVALTDQMEHAILLAQRAEAMLAHGVSEIQLRLRTDDPDKDGTIKMSTDNAFRVHERAPSLSGRVLPITRSTGTKKTASKPLSQP